MDAIQNNNISPPLTAAEAFANIKEMDNKSAVSEYIKEPFKVPTPKEKVMKRPDGFDYVESAWMDSSFKIASPLYTNELIIYNESDNWISLIVRVTDRITGNSELGAGAAQIQVSRSTEKVLDKGNNLTAALSKAIKNAQSRFGHAADIYHKLQELPTDDEKERYEGLLTQIKSINLTRSYTFAEQWAQLGTDYTGYLDRWQIYVDRNSQNQNTQSSQGSNKQSLI